MVPGRVAVLDGDRFDGTDASFVARLYVPGIRRAGDLATAAEVAGARVVLHNVGDRAKLTAAEIVALLKKP
jgi:hypothetical protein